MGLTFYIKKKKWVNKYEFNITHNLARMAKEAGIYECLWRPEEVGAKRAGDVIETLRAGLEKLKADPEYYKQFNAENGWGTYEHLVMFVKNVLDSCVKDPKQKIKVSR
jgi:hypothetical protein